MNSLALSRLVKLKNLLIALPLLFVAVTAVAQKAAPEYFAWRRTPEGGDWAK